MAHPEDKLTLKNDFRGSFRALEYVCYDIQRLYDEIKKLVRIVKRLKLF